MTNIAIIGAGLSGLTAANILKEHADITIFEKSRGVSGRMSTRRAEPYFFDHGAQFFKARSNIFKQFIAPMVNHGIIERWDARFVTIKNQEIINRQKWDSKNPHYVGVPGMNAIAKYLSQGLKIRLETRVESITKYQQKWFLEDDKGNSLGEYDWVICAVLAKQAEGILPPSLPFYCQIEAVKMQACFCLMLGFDNTLNLEFDAALVKNDNISWISVNSNKPRRRGSYSLVVHSTNQWADIHINKDHLKVMEYLCQQTSKIIGHDVSKAKHKSIHGWRYANIENQLSNTYFIDADQYIGVCADWFIKGQVEAAFISGFELANNILGKLNHG